MEFGLQFVVFSASSWSRKVDYQNGLSGVVITATVPGLGAFLAAVRFFFFVGILDDDSIVVIDILAGVAGNL